VPSWTSWLTWLLVGAGCLLVLYGVLVLLARRLPPGPLRDLARLLPDCAVALRRLHRDPRVPTRVRVALWVALLWVVSPVDLIPEFVPILGPLDDVLVVALVLRYAVRSSPPDAVSDAWPGDPDVLRRLTGVRRPTDT
jgi:uncharacterized membrane protein YkvA (DUF1232 family)